MSAEKRIGHYVVQEIKGGVAGKHRYADPAERKRLSEGNQVGFAHVHRIRRGFSTNATGKAGTASRRKRSRSNFSIR